MIAFDHGLHLGVIPGVANGAMLETLYWKRRGCVLVGPGTARPASVFTGRGAPGLIMRVDWTNRWRAECSARKKGAGA